MQPEEVAALKKESKGNGQRKAIEAAYDELLQPFGAGDVTEVTLDPTDNKVNTRNRLRAAAERRGLDITFIRVRDESLLRFELHSANGDQPTGKKK
jgi:predicted kinase